MGIVFALLLSFQVKHFMADYPLQTPYMLGKFQGGWQWVRPLAAHCAVHAYLTLAILAAAHRLDLWWLACVDFALHFLMDRIKASPSCLGRFKALSAGEFNRMRMLAAEKTTKSMAIQSFRSNILFWWSLGLDQMVHHVTHYLIIYCIIAL